MLDVEVGPSAIQGLGVFARRDYAAGERIRRVNVIREVTEAEPLREEAGEYVHHCAHPKGKVVLWGFPDRHVNHCCDPNAFELYEGDAVYIVARRPIRPRDEITFDYNVNTSGGSSWACNCSAARCLGRTTGDFFALPRDRQLEYLPLLAGWFLEKHRERIDLLARPAAG